MSSASSLITRFIDAVHRQDAPEARAVLAGGALLIFPGGRTFTEVEDFFDWAKQRYRTATYRYDSYDEIATGQEIVVYARGKIDGELNDGKKFSEVRFVDRFRIHDNRIVEKEAWSDMADYIRRNSM